tara:strand:- start:143 stop:514 length:372 start_codon:yes stop_codon:yes gene_type:complete
MKYIYLVLSSLFALGLSSEVSKSSLIDEIDSVVLVKDDHVVYSRCPISSAGCLTTSTDGNLTIYIMESLSSSYEDVSLYGLLFDAFQYQTNGAISNLKTCRMKLAYARSNKYREITNLLRHEC